MPPARFGPGSTWGKRIDARIPIFPAMSTSRDSALPGRPRRGALVTLTVAQALGLSAAPLVVMVGGVIGRELAPSPSLSTLPLATMVSGTALMSAPAALLMQRIGRRLGFAGGALFAGIGSLLAALAIETGDFKLFSMATLLIGAHLAFVMQYRFAAAEAAGPERAAQGIALVLAGGIVAGVLGPELGRRGRDLLETAWTGSFVALAVVSGLLLPVVLIGLRHDGHRSSAVRRRQDRHPRGSLLRHPAFLFAVAAGITAYAVMTLVMTATPLAMHGAGFDVDASARVIQAHVVAMYAPSLIAGILVARFGIGRLMAAGVIAMAGCTAIGFSGRGLSAWVTALALLGAGWNVLFLGGTVALARAFPGDDRYRAQAANDLLVFGTQAMASLSAGAVLSAGGWRAINGLALVPLVCMTAILAGRAIRAREPGRAGEAS